MTSQLPSSFNKFVGASREGYKRKIPAHQEVHSVIVNLNKNFSNNKGNSFQTIFNSQLTLKPYSMVALYTGSLTRKPIVISEDTTLTIQLNSALPTLEQEVQLVNSLRSDYEAVQISPFANLDVVIPAGEYSKLNFCRVFCDAINRVLTEPSTAYKNVDTDIIPNAAKKLLKSFPYEVYYEMLNGQFFLGLRYLVQTANSQGNTISDDLFLTTFESLNDGLTDTSNVTLAGPNQNIIHRTTAGNDWNSWALGNSPIRGMASYSGEDPRILGDDIGFSSALIRATLPASGTEAYQFVFGLNNTFMSEFWANDTIATPLVKVNPVDSKPTLILPQVLLGAHLDIAADDTEITKAILTLFAPVNLMSVDYATFSSQGNRDTQASITNQTLFACDLRDWSISLDDGCLMAWEVYSEAIPSDKIGDNLILQEGRRYFFRFVVNSPSNSNESQTILFDSKTTNIYLSNDLVESGYLFQQMRCFSDDTAPKATTGGLCPQFYFYNSNENFKVIEPKANNIVGYDKSRTEFIYMEGQLGYSYFINPDKASNPIPLTNVLGVAENVPSTINNNEATTTIFSPNAYPRTPELGGITQLGSDLTRYNIEVNLPISCYNSTEGSANDIGQTRTILHNTNPIVEDITNLSTGVITRSLEPFNTKYLSLNNPQQIKLNMLDVSIRRSKTNELADEITDASIEMLIKKDIN